MFLPQAFLQERWQPAKIAGNDVNETDSKTCPAKDGVEILGIPGPLKWQNPMQWKENWCLGDYTTHLCGNYGKPWNKDPFFKQVSIVASKFQMFFFWLALCLGEGDTWKRSLRDRQVQFGNYRTIDRYH